MPINRNHRFSIMQINEHKFQGGGLQSQNPLDPIGLHRFSTQGIGGNQQDSAAAGSKRLGPNAIGEFSFGKSNSFGQSADPSTQ